MELVLFGILLVLALLVPWLGRDSREPGDWNVPFESRRSPRSAAVSDHFSPTTKAAADPREPQASTKTSLVRGLARHGH